MLRRTLFSMTTNNSLTPLFVMLVIIEKGGVAKGRRGTVDLLIAVGLERLEGKQGGREALGRGGAETGAFGEGGLRRTVSLAQLPSWLIKAW